MWPFQKPGPKFYTHFLIAFAIIALSICSISFKVAESPDTDNRTHEPPPPPTAIPDYELYAGNMARPDEYPYHTSVQLNKRHLCSGSLVSLKHVLTVAHCLYGKDTSQIKIVTGTVIIPGGKSYGISKFIPHPSYNGTDRTLKNDVGVVRLKNSVTESKYVKIILLPSLRQKVYYQQELDISNFFLRWPGDGRSAYLKKFTRYVDNTRCKRYFQQRDLSGKFCAVASPRYVDCLYDTGCPATINKTYIIGIFTVFSTFGCSQNVPQLFAHVPDYLEFIQAVINGNR